MLQVIRQVPGVHYPLAVPKPPAPHYGATRVVAAEFYQDHYHWLGLRPRNSGGAEIAPNVQYGFGLKIELEYYEPESESEEEEEEEDSVDEEEEEKEISPSNEGSEDKEDDDEETESESR